MQAMAGDTTDFAVIGGGVVGSAIAYGLAKRGARVIVLDEGDVALRASRVNFGLVWLHSKGDGMPEYGFWTRRSADLWPAFAEELAEATGTDTQYRKSGGLSYCLGEQEYEARKGMIARMRGQAGEDPYETRMLDRMEVRELLPRMTLGPDVTGASYGPHDGHVSPLRLLQSLHAGMRRHGADYRPDTPARTVHKVPGGFVIETPRGPLSAGRVVLAAGHGITGLMRPLGFDVAIQAQRGQQLVTERFAPMLPIPANGIRQTGDGTFLIGTTKEDTGFDVSTTAEAGATMAARVVRVFPALAQARIVRAWAGIRTLTADEAPVYEESASCPGAYLATCHSGVTLAAVHAVELAGAIHDATVAEKLAAFHSRRFRASG